MASQLTVLKELAPDHWVVTAAIGAEQTLPTTIFLYTNTGTVLLGSYVGVVGIENMPSTQVWDGATVIPPFGNKYLRHDQAKINVGFSEDVDAVIASLVASVQTLSTAYQAAASSTIIYDIT